jgi:hypothetical protein
MRRGKSIGAVPSACTDPAGSTLVQVTLREGQLPPGAAGAAAPVLVGSCPELGNWEPSRGLPLRREPGGWAGGRRERLHPRRAEGPR